MGKEYGDINVANKSAQSLPASQCSMSDRYFQGQDENSENCYAENWKALCGRKNDTYQNRLSLATKKGERTSSEEQER